MKRIIGNLYNLIKKQSSMKSIASFTLGLLMCLMFMTACGGQSNNDEGNGNNVMQNNQATPAPISTPTPTPPPQQNIETQQPPAQIIANNRWVFVDVTVDNPEITREEIEEGFADVFDNFWIIFMPDGISRGVSMQAHTPRWVTENILWGVENDALYFFDGYWDRSFTTMRIQPDGVLISLNDNNIVEYSLLGSRLTIYDTEATGVVVSYIFEKAVPSTPELASEVEILGRWEIFDMYIFRQFYQDVANITDFYYSYDFFADNTGRILFGRSDALLEEIHFTWEIDNGYIVLSNDTWIDNREFRIDNSLLVIFTFEHGFHGMFAFGKVDALTQANNDVNFDFGEFTELIGNWRISRNNNRIAFEFHPDGTLIYNVWRFGETEIFSVMEGTWYAIGENRITMNLPNHLFLDGDFDFNIWRDTLVLTGINIEVMVFRAL